MVVTDLDGTLLGPDRTVSSRDLQTLTDLGRAGVCRVIATGRSRYSAASVLPDDLPVDYLIFSSGAGIVDRKTGQMLYARNLSAETADRVAGFLTARRLDFMIQSPIPDNHRFTYVRVGRSNPDFERRIILYRKFARPLDRDVSNVGEACQIIVIVPEATGPSIYHDIKRRLAGVKVIRTTSPLDGQSIWIEIFPDGVSKAHAAQWLCDRHAIHPSRTLGIGNDYNDLDLLEWAGHSRVMANAPPVMMDRFDVTDSNRNSGFTHAVTQHIAI